ncbi:DUF2946 family protein [Sphingomonas sp. CFBP 13720]|uniref:DUF2946 family protein n=1 Tax=Sphingomonas sp. CFBP 13720 TaxID=2775302 RepID=UPI0017835661|nr:hypothetical protein [Sphingomonas sp. CFBP 13720]
MQAIRHLLAQRHLAVLICAATLLLKLMVPTGYMIASTSGGVSITLCPGAAPVTTTMAMPGMHGDMAGHDGSKDHDTAPSPCAFTILSAASLGAIDPVQFVALVAFILALGLIAVVLPAPLAPAYLRPPLRGPPAQL